MLDPADLMPVVAAHQLPALSLFSGGGGLDLGFTRAGFAHVAAYDTLEAAGHTLRQNRPDWTVHAGADGDVKGVDWRAHRDELAVIHGGPPCQPFSVAGRQRGREDERNLLPEFVRAVREARRRTPGSRRTDARSESGPWPGRHRRRRPGADPAEHAHRPSTHNLHPEQRVSPEGLGSDADLAKWSRTISPEGERVPNGERAPSPRRG